MAQMERRAQMVINTCTALGEQNPIGMIHDVGAGGLSNALPERELCTPSDIPDPLQF
jgi:phosphoribosylformylglycinamidine (FGAM) synthase-like enzyme